MRILVACVTTAALGCAATPASALELEPCRIGGVKAGCGRLEVAENRDDPDGRRIGLNVVVVPARSENPRPDPLFFFHGGPGGAATTLASALLGLPFRKERDLVFVDQRGTGDSHPISCGDSDAQSLLTSFARFDLSEQLACLDRIDADTRFYTTREFVQDIDEVRAALGAERINILGGSYGSRAALDYMTAFPGRTRSAILRGVAPAGFVLPRDFARDSQAALDELLRDCAADRGCNAAFPDLKRKIEAIVQRLTGEPVEVAARDPRTQRRFTVSVDREMFAAAVHYTLYGSAFAAALPSMIESAHDGDLEPLVDSMVRFVSNVGSTMSDGLFLSVACAEDLPFVSDEEMRRRGEGTLLGSDFAVRLKRTCERWPHADLPASIKVQPRIETPILLINGEVDPVTPPHHTERILDSLPNALHLVVPDTGHADLFPGCVLGIATRFLEAGSAAGLSTGCLESIRRPAFAID